MQHRSPNTTHDLIMMHVPYNFGHTIEKVALFDKGTSRLSVGAWIMTTLGGFGNHKGNLQGLWKKIEQVKRPNGMVWGHFNPDLNAISNVTGCSLYYTPQKYWPEDLARQYFGDKTVFGLLRDPYERLVAMVRGSAQLAIVGNDYGNAFDTKYVSTCNVNKAIKKAMKKYIAGNDKYVSACTFLPQAEFFDGPYGIALPVDNRLFPDSMNKVFIEHGYTDMHIDRDDIFHVNGCLQSWAADLDDETKQLVRQVYARDFDLLCKHFGYCNFEENTCIHGVPQMCPREACATQPCAAGLGRFNREFRLIPEEKVSPYDLPF